MGRLHGQIFHEGHKTNDFTVYGHSVAQTPIQALKQCVDDLSRASTVRQAAAFHDLQIGTLRPGIAINTNQTGFAPIKRMQMPRFNGQTWELFSPILNGAVTGG